MTSSVLASLFLAAALGPALNAQSPWCRYQRATLGTVIHHHQADLVDNPPADQRHWFINNSFWGARVRVIYVGRTHHLESADSMFLDGYLYRVTPDSDFRALFHNEASFIEGQDTLWLAIQDSLIPELANEASPGDTVTLFASWLGAHQEGRRTKWVFTVNEFATSKSQAGWDEALASCPPQ
jgi:hypothetical protein